MDRPVLRFPDDELELLTVFGALGVNTAEMGMRDGGGGGGGGSGLGSSAVAGLTPPATAAICGLSCICGGGAGPDSLCVAASASAFFSALVGRPRFRLAGGSLVDGCAALP